MFKRLKLFAQGIRDLKRKSLSLVHGFPQNIIRLFLFPKLNKGVKDLSVFQTIYG